jgi:flagellar basal-body rod modification protein FlgD
MDLSFMMSGLEQQKLNLQVDSINKALTGTREADKNLGKDDFLKLLITQLTHQDPTQPMEDREFIAQMAQFSALEQMTNMNESFTSLSNMLASNQAMGLLGKTVEIVDGETVITGKVEEIAGREFPQVLVNGKYYDYAQVEKIRGE